MLKSIRFYTFSLCFFCLFFAEHTWTLAQQNQAFFKFPIIDAGVYKITAQQAQSLGYSNLDAIGIYGTPGMLPQKLDSLDLKFRQIPTKRIGNDLYFFLTGPHQITVNDGNFDFQVHHYSDTLFYLLGPAEKHLEIPDSTVPASGPELPRLFGIQFIKWEETNLLTSGRSWYSRPIFNRDRISFNFSALQGANGSPELTLKVMGQSLSEGRMEFFHNNTLVGNLSIASIPNSQYGIKGRENTFRTNLSPSPNYNIQANFNSGDVNGTGYLSHGLLAFPFSPSSAPSGKYLIRESGVVPKRTGFQQWLVRGFYKVTSIENPVLAQSGDQLLLFNLQNIPTISNLERIDLKARTERDNPQLIIITSSSLLSQANRLASHKNQIGIRTQVYTVSQLYEAFAYGNKDITAFRNFLAFQYHQNRALKNVLFFGKGTFDYKGILGGRPNLVPTYSSRNSLDPLSTFSSDDYFGFLDFGQGEWAENTTGDELLQVGVGRIPATNFQEAREAVNKIISYESMLGMEGTWKRRLAFFADDGDNNIHLNDAESHASFIQENHPEFEIVKLYLDRFEQERNNNIQRSPEARDALQSTIKEGVLFLNYIGHGNETTLTAERVFTVSDINDWPENPFLPLFITATCEFGRQDSPFIRSGAEDLLFAPRKGAIGLLTTGRPVFSSVNFSLNKAFIEAVFQRENGSFQDLGSIFKSTKNNSLNGPFNRNFSLIGDPSLRLAVPELKADAPEIWDIRLEMETDTLKALQQVQIKGKIIEPLTGAHLINTKGEFILSLFDRPNKVKTLGDESSEVEFWEENNLLFQGIGKVNDGEFIADLILPGNIEMEHGIGTLRIFAELASKNEEAFGAKRLIIGGMDPNQPEDLEGPKIRLFFGENLELTAPIIPSRTYPVKIQLEDESGINISGSDPNQGINLQINNDPPILLNRHFFALDGSFKKGEIITDLTNLQEGMNSLKISAWDNSGNKSELNSSIEVRGSLKIQILHALTYPNPANELSKFRILHNRPGENLLLTFEVYSVMGETIFNISKRYVEAENILEDLEWIFFHTKTKNPTKGTYIYKLQLRSEVDGTSDSWSGKIIIQ
ncbi:type IX secretion system sortase PorU [Cecembia rubra]|uniref:type IX secretion system sortase PorU n=1 Tax=Cecembia rubra TaxID=1485585 RepID=UPI00271452DE|nr:type IX secretion system sortase PorU [Cecembia rubra]